ncbi:hypothetical protein BDR22DRAFT_963045 [Usnea florida]
MQVVDTLMRSTYVDTIIKKRRQGALFPAQADLNKLWKLTGKVFRLRRLLLDLFAAQCQGGRESERHALRGFDPTTIQASKPSQDYQTYSQSEKLDATFSLWVQKVEETAHATRRVFRQVNQPSQDLSGISSASLRNARLYTIAACAKSRRLVLTGERNEVSNFCVEAENEGHQNRSTQERPDWLLIELEGDFLIRPIQAREALEMIQLSSSTNSLVQLNMGEVKSSVIVPLVAITIAGHLYIYILRIWLFPLTNAKFRIILIGVLGFDSKAPFIGNARLVIEKKWVEVFENLSPRSPGIVGTMEIVREPGIVGTMEIVREHKRYNAKVRKGSNAAEEDIEFVKSEKAEKLQWRSLSIKDLVLLVKDARGYIDDAGGETTLESQDGEDEGASELIEHQDLDQSDFMFDNAQVSPNKEKTLKCKRPQ